ncbi:MAG: CPBP family intramembrane metalloprotease [Planctomycetes bacterium]|nr:CPBP family intramembrane metalloprotease [Planctomycetota bacterium]
MPKSAESPVVRADGYFAWSRDPAIGVVAVLPLWLAYEILRLRLTPDERNGAEVMLLDALGMLGHDGLAVLRAAFGCLVLFASLSLLRRQIPWFRVGAVSALEGIVYGLMLGPLAGVLAASAGRVLACRGVPESLSGNLVGSLGAGIFEEIVFRLGLMSALVWLWLKAARAFALPRTAGVIVAVLVSAVVFSWFHHLWGQPFDRAAFLFRCAAGVLLGALFWLRGIGVCVYTHAAYDVHYYLTHP